MMKKTLTLALIAGAAACGSDEPGRIARNDQPLDVVVSAALEAPTAQSFPATVVSERTAEIATRMSGRVDRMHVDVGASVKEGDPLVSLASRDIDARVEAAEAALVLAERSYRRLERLAADGAASQHELDQAKAAFDAASAAAADATAQRAYATVRAPFAGVIVSRSVDPGDLATPGAPLLTLVEPGALKVVADLPAERYGILTAGARVLVELPGHATAIPALVSRTVPALGGSSRTFRVEAGLEAEVEALPGAYARIRVPGRGTGSVWVPRDAIVERGQLRGVVTLAGDTLRLRWIRLGQVQGDAVELLSGPPAPFSVVRRPAPGLMDGATVGRVTNEPWAGPARATAGEEVAQ